MSNMAKTGKIKYHALFFDKDFLVRDWRELDIYANDILDAFKVLRQYRPRAASISIKEVK